MIQKFRQEDAKRITSLLCTIFCMIASSVVELLPPEFLAYAFALQRGEPIHWSALRALVRNGLAVRRVGTWGLTSSGLAAAGLAQHEFEAGRLALDAALEPYEPEDIFETGSRTEAEEEAEAEQEVLAEEDWAEREVGILTGREEEGAVREVEVGSGRFLTEQDLRDAATRGKADRRSGHFGSVAIKQSARGGWRWTTISSSGYRDVDDELVTRAALAEDVRRADADGDYGPLVWWHEYEPMIVDPQSGKHLIYKAMVLGHCDFNAMAGPFDQFLLESGTFINDKVARAMADHADDLAVSIQFGYRERDLDSDGVYRRVRRRERSLLPRGREANLFTSLAIG